MLAYVCVGEGDVRGMVVLDYVCVCVGGGAVLLLRHLHLFILNACPISNILSCSKS